MRKWNSTKIIAFGFALMILLGACLLCLPAASRDGEGIPFTSALFTATSSSCVTGLSLFDTWTQFSFFGQLIILILIQIGGLGFMAAAMLVSLAFRRKVGLRERSLLEDTMDSLQLSGVVRLTRRMLTGTALLEASGALLLALRFVPLFGFRRGAWMAVFHSVSAFCNAGFDLCGFFSPEGSLTAFSGDPLVILTISFLIITGGLGFIVWNDLLEKKFRLRELCLHAKVVLWMTGILLACGTAAFYFSEAGGIWRGMGQGERILASFFQSVTTRTAGFYSVPQTSLSAAGILISIFLMLAGAAPGGTGGGLKVTTLAVILADGFASQRGRRDAEMFRFRISPDTVRRAYAGTVLYLTLAAAGIFVLMAQGVPGTRAVFEAVSAIGTVGLSMGLTPSLPLLSRMVILLLMYAGRVGSLTVFLAIMPGQGDRKLKNPVGKIIVG